MESTGRLLANQGKTPPSKPRDCVRFEMGSGKELREFLVVTRCTLDRREKAIKFVEFSASQLRVSRAVQPKPFSFPVDCPSLRFKGHAFATDFAVDLL